MKPVSQLKKKTDLDVYSCISNVKPGGVVFNLLIFERQLAALNQLAN